MRQASAALSRAFVGMHELRIGIAGIETGSARLQTGSAGTKPDAARADAASARTESDGARIETGIAMVCGCGWRNCFVRADARYFRFTTPGKRIMRNTLSRCALAAVLALPASGFRLPAQPKPPEQPKGSLADAIRIPFERYTLPSNGLTVILAEDHSTPMVAVDVWFHVGSKNEVVGRTGFAHLFEHVMFMGSGHVAYGMHDRYTEGVGGRNNGSTTNDRTNYYETSPSNYLESQFWLESDRMGWLLDALDQRKLNQQRDVVMNERRQAIDNQPYGRKDEIMAGAPYPKNQPRSWHVIGR